MELGIHLNNIQIKVFKKVTSTKKCAHFTTEQIKDVQQCLNLYFSVSYIFFSKLDSLHHDTRVT